MHIPDGMLSNAVTAGAAATSAGFVGYAVAWCRKNLSDQRTVLMSVMAALVFALQMLNFPIAPGISGHFAGGAAAAILLGPWPAVIVLTTVLLVQAFLFADGGVLALGANVLNLAVIGPLVGYAVWVIGGPIKTTVRGRAAVAFAAAWAAVMASALAVAGEIVLSGRAPTSVAFGALAGWHALVGIGEGVITAGLVGFVAASRPDLMDAEAAGPTKSSWSVALALGLIAAAAAGLSFLASSSPDALEFAAASKGFDAEGAALASPLADYAVPGLSNQVLAGILAGLVGALIAGLLLFGATGAFRRSRSRRHAGDFHEHEHEHADSAAHAHPHHHPADGHEHAHPLSFERYTYVVSPVHSLDPRAKVTAAGLFVSGVVLAPAMRPVEFAAAFALLMAVTVLSRVPIRVVLLRSALVLPVAVTIALFAPFMPGGWVAAWSIVSKAWLSAYTVLLVSATTPPHRLLLGLRRMGLPAVFVGTLTFLNRFSSVLRDQVLSMRRAMSSRAPLLSGWRRVALYGNLAGNLFIRSYERAERVYASMLSRGFNGEFPSAEVMSMRFADFACIGAALLAATATVLYS